MARKSRSQFFIVTAFLLCAMSPCACCIDGFMYIDRDWVPSATIARLPNATKDDVREMIGEPLSVDLYNGGEKWCYQREYQIAEFCVIFSAAGRVVSWHYDR